MDQERIGKFIQQLRKEKKLTQEKLAEKLGVTSKSISRWETGKYLPDLSLLKPLSEILGITINELMSGEKVSTKEYQNRFEENVVTAISDVENKNKKRKMLSNICMGSIFFIIIYIIGYYFYTTFYITQKYDQRTMQFDKANNLEQFKNSDTIGDQSYALCINTHKGTIGYTRNLIIDYEENGTKYGAILLQNQKTLEQILKKVSVPSSRDLTINERGCNVFSLENSNIPENFKVYYTTTNLEKIATLYEKGNNTKILEIIKKSTLIYESNP